MTRVAGVMDRLFGRDVLGVRLGVLVLVFPVVSVSMYMQMKTRGIWNHPPDSRYYLTMMSRDMGHGVTDSIHRTREVAPWPVAPWYFSNTEPTWQLVKTRGLYPLLSVPFVWIMGLERGSLAVVTLSVLAFCWITARPLQRLYGPAVAVFTVGAFSLTTTVLAQVWATTDTLAMALAAVLVANLPIERSANRANLVWLGAATVFIALTRQVGVLAPAMAGAGWLWCLVRERRRHNRWLSSLAVTACGVVVVQVVTMLVAKVDTQGILARGETTAGGVISQFWHSLFHVTHQAISYMWASDQILYALLIAAGLLAVARFTTDVAAVFLGAVAATYLLTAGVGFSANMRYEMIMFPAAALAAGGFVAWMVHGLAPGTEPDLEARRAASGLEVGSGPGRGAARRGPGATGEASSVWIPQLVFTGGLLAVLIVVTCSGGSRSTIAAPASASFAAAQGSATYAVRPLATPQAEVTLKAAITQAAGAANGGGLEGPFDWVHDLRYRPTASDQPGWSDRAADGTTVTRVNAMTSDESTAFGNAISFDRTAEPDTVTVVSRQTTAFGQDVTFTVEDSSGTTHRGTATTLYPIWDAGAPGLVTSLVFDP